MFPLGACSICTLPPSPPRRSSDLSLLGRPTPSASRGRTRSTKPPIQYEPWRGTSWRGAIRRQHAAVEQNAGDGPELCPGTRSEEHTSELQSLRHLVCRLLLEKKKT